MAKDWPQVRVVAVDGLPEAQLAVGSRVHVRARVRLGAIAPGEVAVELYLGRINAHSEISDGVAIPMEATGESHQGVHVFQAAAVPCRDSGLHGYTVRVVPFHPDEAKSFLPGMITWADGR
jgi:starch phosphorylase